MERILLICSSWPHGRTFGGQLRVLQTARALEAIGRVSILLVGSDAADVEARRATEEEYEVFPPILPIVAAKPTVGQKVRRALDVNYLNVHGCSASLRDQEAAGRLTREHDFVWVANSRTPNILQRWSWPDCHLDIDDVPSTYQGALAECTKSIVERWKARIDQKLMYRRELLWKRRFRTLSVCSDADRRYLCGGSETHVIPNGFERPESEPVRRRSISPPCIGFIGLYDYPPNREGLHWFLSECWPLLCKDLPEVRLRLIGSGTERINGRNLWGVEGFGWVKDPAAEIATWSAMVIPIRIGGGTRVKLVDAFSRKCPVVSTSLGAYGYNVDDGRHLRIADSAKDFAAACVELIKFPEQGTAMAERAWEAFLERWTWDSIAPKILAAAEECIRKTHRGRSIRTKMTGSLNPV